jgi:Flp pilus assembly protein TadD
VDPEVEAGVLGGGAQVREEPNPAGTRDIAADEVVATSNEVIAASIGNVVQAQVVYGGIHLHAADDRELGLAGGVSIAPRQAEFPVRGRDSVVSTLLDAPSGTVQVLCAAGGRGKTTVLAAVADRARSQGARVWWVSAADAPRLSADMRALAAQLGASPDRLRLAWSGREGDAADLVWELLGEHSRPWLLVIDSADDVRVLAGPDGRIADGTGWIRRPASLGRLIVASRNRNQDAWGRWVQLSTLDDLSTEHAVEMLYDRVGVRADSPAQAAALANRLGCMPLLLHQAGLYLARANQSAPWPAARPRPRTFDEYREALDDRFDALVDGSPSPYQTTRPRDRVAMTWELSLEQLTEHGVLLARPLLRLLACFADAPIPYTLVLSPSVLATFSLGASPTSRELEQAIDALADFGLLDKQAPEHVDDDPGAYTALVHPLIGETMRNHPDARDQRGSYLVSAARGLSDATRTRDVHDPAHSSFWQLTASHLHRLCTLATAMGEDVPTPVAESLTKVATACIEYSTDAGVYSQAEMAASEITPLAVRLPDEQPVVLRLRYHKARLKDYHGNLGIREGECRTVLAIQQRVLGDRHPNTLETRNGLAWVLAEQRGDLVRAEAEYRTVLDLRRETLGEDHRDTLDTWHNLAATLGRRNDRVGAETEYRALLAVQRRTLGDDYPNTLWTRNGLAWVLSERGDFANAEAEHRTVLVIQRRTLGALHPDTLWTRHNIARVLGQRGDLAASEAEYRSVMADRARVLGEDHHSTLYSWHDLAGILGLKGDLVGAETEFRRVLTRQRHALGDEHPDTLLTRHDLAVIVGRRGDLDRAEAELREVLAIRTRVLGDDHPATVGSRGALQAIVIKRQP